MKHKLVVGNKAFVRLVGGEARYIKSDNIEDYIREVEIVRVGRKYFWVRINYRDIQFKIEDLSQVYEYGSAGFIFYFNKQDIYDRAEKNDLLNKFRGCFDHWGSSRHKFTLEQLRRIDEIIKEVE